MVGRSKNTDGCFCTWRWILKLQHVLSFSESSCQLCKLLKNLSFSYIFLSYSHCTFLLHHENRRRRGNPHLNSWVDFYQWLCHQELSPQMIFSLLLSPWRLNPVLTGCENKRPSILSCTCYSHLETTRYLTLILEFSLTLFEFLWWDRLLADFKILKPCLTKLSKVRVFYGNDHEILITYYNKYSHWQFCESATALLVWLGSAGITSRLQIGSLSAPDNFSFYSPGCPEQLLSVACCPYGGEQKIRSERNTPPKGFCSELSHQHFIHIPLVKAQGQFTRPSTRSV